MTGYLVEWSLSMDNVFVFAVIFRFFSVPLKYQYRVLFWGILGAIVMRLAFILAGTALLHHFDWVLRLFGVFLIYTGFKLALQQRQRSRSRTEPPDAAGQQLFPVAEGDHGERVLRRRKRPPGDHAAVPGAAGGREHRRGCSPSTACRPSSASRLDPFIVFTSNIFAILGLRALYFLLAGVMDLFRYLNYGLAAVLVFVGGKMVVDYWFEHGGSAAGRPSAGCWSSSRCWALSIVASLVAASDRDEPTRRKRPSDRARPTIDAAPSAVALLTLSPIASHI